MSHLRLVVALLLFVSLAACGEREPVDHPAPPVPEGTPGEAWWLLRAPDYELVGGGPTPAEVSGTTGSLWMLEYDTVGQSVRLVADQAGGLFSNLAAASPEVGTATVDGVEVTLRQHPGRPEEGIAPSIGADWTDNGVFISFGGAGLTEVALRELLDQVHRVTREEWEAAAATIPPTPPSEGDPPGPLASVVP